MNIILISLLAGLSSLIGFFIIFINIDYNKLLSISLSLSAGILLGISIFDLLFESITLLNNYYLFFITFIITFLILFIINKKITINNKLYKTGIMTLISLILHNIPEGILTFSSFNIDQKLGISVTISIILHNIPEGIAIAVPIYYSTKSKIKAFFYTLISSIAEPLGALISILFLKEFINNLSLGLLLSSITGIMVYISIFKLLDESYSYNSNKQLLCFFIGILFIVIYNLIW